MPTYLLIPHSLEIISLCISWLLGKYDVSFSPWACEILIKRNCECQLLSLCCVVKFLFGVRQFSYEGQVLLSGNHGYTEFP